jgi:heat-inducible transcriptional repressor
MHTLNLTERQKLLLTLVIHEYTRLAAPISSNHLVKDYGLNMSSATVRNELAELTNLGFLRQPHTSSGRIPTEEGYRYFVGRLLQKTNLPVATRHTITHQFYQMRNDVEQWMRLAASVLAQQSHAASLVTAPHPTRAVFKHLELISTRGRQVLMVLVMAGGEICQRLITLDEPENQENLSVTANHLTGLFYSKGANEIRPLVHHLSELDQFIGDIVATEIEKVNTSVAGEIYLDGLAYVMSEPEFVESEEMRRSVQILQEPSSLQDLLSHTVLTDKADGVQVLIGSEGAIEELSQCSIVLARYGAPGQTTGTLGVLGPMRMYYGRSISTVSFLSNLLSNLVTETLVE